MGGETETTSVPDFRSSAHALTTAPWRGTFPFLHAETGKGQFIWHARTENYSDSLMTKSAAMFFNDCWEKTGHIRNAS